MSSDVFTTQVDEKFQEMLEVLDSIDVDNIKSEGVSLSFGGKTFKFKGLEVLESNDIENSIRNEFKEKLNQQQQRIREKINSKINQLLVMHQQKQQELDRKEQILQRKYSQSAMMPEISEVHASKGLSVVKGNGNGELTWIFRAIYNPRFIDHKPISKRLVNKMKQDILIMIRTKDRTINSIRTKKYTREIRTTGLTNFPHYHQQTTQDCWGTWRFPREYNTADDIIKIAKDAEAVLENINTGSVANRSPSGLPRIETLKNNIEVHSASRTDGPSQVAQILEEEDVWQTV